MTPPWPEGGAQSSSAIALLAVDHTLTIELFLSQKYPVFGPPGNQSVLTLEKILLCVFSLLTCQYPIFICTHRAASFY